ncbi:MULTISPECIES: hypothetical protein [Cyanophyceae]|uniref:hypothetical protein n=1 Tax=Cyanophyceae TaxID=3028117 RepID=UPI0016890C44|nr:MULTISPECIES: hypothetical protein [Cyanophyceae]MBD1914614.1 hypothetical protein [Phormidium sp. FACHB-77]MBD2031007.1 hypothetical protein [Phormidium sp. FACHB-322]MBD2052614.1 hypothetical protein [Leptolyngbya sp. FACHB-60]
MPTLNSQQEKTLTAFITALGQQDNALPEGLQKQLHAIGQNLEARILELPAIAASLPNLNQAYQTALSDTQGNTGTPAATFASSTNQSDSDKQFNRAVDILTADDPVQAARRSKASLGQIASNPLKRLFSRG